MARLAVLLLPLPEKHSSRISILGGTLGFFVGLAISVALSTVAGAIIPVPVRLVAGFFSGLIFAYLGTAVGSVHGSRIVGKGWEEERVMQTILPRVEATAAAVSIHWSGG